MVCEVDGHVSSHAHNTTDLQSNVSSTTQGELAEV
jgi:hypothetical protein